MNDPKLIPGEVLKYPKSEQFDDERLLLTATRPEKAFIKNFLQIFYKK